MSRNLNIKKEQEGQIQQKHIDAVKTLLEFIGEDPSREGLQDTPKRFLKAWRDCWGRGYRQNPSEFMKVFSDGAGDYDEMILVKNIKVFSHCEHHLAPIVGVAHVAYIPNALAPKVAGLSKLNRLVDTYSRRLQVQERLTTQIAAALQQNLAPLGVGVVIAAEHFCVKTRGVEDVNSATTTSKLLGVFKERAEVREEFMRLIKE